MIDSIFEFDDLLAYEIMTPRTDVFMIDIDDDREEYFDELMELRYSRIPVYRDDPDNIIGILHIKDYLFQASQHGFDNVNFEEILREPYFVPETFPSSILLSRLVAILRMSSTRTTGSSRKSAIQSLSLMAMCIWTI